MEARGEIRGGRFVATVVGEQFALPEAIEALRAARRAGTLEEIDEVSAYDPLQFALTLLPQTREANVVRQRREA
jgi:ATP-dependent helicase Lhr and Lhr-like helicase